MQLISQASNYLLLLPWCLIEVFWVEYDTGLMRKASSPSYFPMSNWASWLGAGVADCSPYASSRLICMCDFLLNSIPNKWYLLLHTLQMMVSSQMFSFIFCSLTRFPRASKVSQHPDTEFIMFYNCRTVRVKLKAGEKHSCFSPHTHLIA